MIVGGFLIYGQVASPSPGKHWEHVGTIGKIRVVLVDLEQVEDEVIYNHAARTLCGRVNDVCGVWFVRHGAEYPRHAGDWERLAHTWRATYMRNPNTGHSGFSWSCFHFPERRPDCVEG